MDDADGIWKPPVGYRPNDAPLEVREAFYRNLQLALEEQGTCNQQPPAARYPRWTFRSSSAASAAAATAAPA